MTGCEQSHFQRICHIFRTSSIPGERVAYIMLTIIGKIIRSEHFLKTVVEVGSSDDVDIDREDEPSAKKVFVGAIWLRSLIDAYATKWSLQSVIFFDGQKKKCRLHHNVNFLSRFEGCSLSFDFFRVSRGIRPRSVWWLAAEANALLWVTCRFKSRSAVLLKECRGYLGDTTKQVHYEK